MENTTGGRRSTRCPSPDITEVAESLKGTVRTRSAKGKKTLNEIETDNKIYLVEEENEDMPAEEPMDHEDVDETYETAEVPVKSKGRGRPRKANKKGGGAAKRRGGSKSGKKGAKLTNASPENDDASTEIKQELKEDAIDELEANVKEIAISPNRNEVPSSSLMDVDAKLVASKKGSETSPGVASIFNLKEEKKYDPGYIPGLDLLQDDSIVESSAGTHFFNAKDFAVCSEDKQINDDLEGTKIRRSSRIKSLEEQRGSRGRRREVVFSSAMDTSLSRSMPNLNDDDSSSNGSSCVQNTSGNGSPIRDTMSSGFLSAGSTPNLSSSFGALSSSSSGKPLKVKSRWRYSSDAESLKVSNDGMSSVGSLSSMNSSIFESMSSLDADQDGGPENYLDAMDSDFIAPTNLIKRSGHLLFDPNDNELTDKLKKFQGIEDTIFRTERKISKESRGMVCDCFLTNEDEERGEIGCNEDCLNRLLMVECGPRCPTGDRCTNKRFQRKEYSTLEVFKTEKKGHGLRTLQYIPEGGFVIEYIGEVLDPTQFEKRTKEYAKGNQEHFYFMALKSDAIIDATLKGNCSRFINHSCEPNCETQKWTVNGELRIGFFTLRDLKPGEEIVFDYQFQRYGKKAQRCYCQTPSCRGWIGEEDEDEEEEDEDEEDEDEEEEKEEVHETEVAIAEEAEVSEEEEPVKVKKKVRRVVRRKRKEARILEDVALEEELVQLERSGLRNRNHTLTLSRLMVRAEKWEDRERILNILINGDPPCRRLFLDYRGLKLLHNWMINLPLPSVESEEQLIKNEEYHQLFLKALSSLSIPNKTMLLDSKILSLIDTWALAPSKTISTKTNVNQSVNEQAMDSLISITPPVLKQEVEMEDISKDKGDAKMSETVNEEQMEIQPSEIIDHVPSTETSEITWNFVRVAKSLLNSWSDLKEVFRIPKKERVEQMKEHEREADKGSNLTFGSSDTFVSTSYSYDRDGRSKWNGRISRDRRIGTIDSFSLHRQTNRVHLFPNLSKEERRSMFAAKVAQEEEDMKQRKMQEEIVSLHQHRCGLLGLDPCTTPVVDVSGHYFLDPKTIEWKLINLQDPTLPPELLLLVNAALKPGVTPPIEEPAPIPAEPEFVFPPWPEGLLPPPPLPPATLPAGWKMAIDDEGRCYYYHIKTQHTQWHPPAIDGSDLVLPESSDSSESVEDIEIEVAVENIPPAKAPIQTLRTKLIERAERRKKSGLVQERIISPRNEEDKTHISKAVIRARKLEVLEEKKLKATEVVSKSEGLDTVDDSSPHQTPPDEKLPPPVETSTEINSNPPAKKRKAEETSTLEAEDSESIRPDSEENSPITSSPIETELDISLAAAEDDDEESVPSKSSKSSDATTIPGLGIDPRDRIGTSSSMVVIKKDRALKIERKQKSQTYKKLASDKSKEAFRNQIANVVVTHLNPYRKPECKSGRIVSTEDFKHLARKMTHAILLKELKHTREGKTLEVTESVKHKTKEYIKKFMGRYGNSNYVPSPEDSQAK